jgi:hypothetical protein
MVYFNEKSKKCCAEEVRRLWTSHGGSTTFVGGGGNCPICKGYIGLSATSEEQANEFLKEFDLEPIVNPKPKPDREKFEYSKKQLMYSVSHYLDVFQENGRFFEDIVDSEKELRPKVNELALIIANDLLKTDENSNYANRLKNLIHE